MSSQGPHRTEVPAVECQNGFSAIVPRQHDVDRISQVQIEIGIARLDVGGGVERFDPYLGDVEAKSPGLRDDKGDDRGAC